MTTISDRDISQTIPQDLKPNSITSLSNDKLNSFCNEIEAIGKSAIKELGNKQDERHLKKIKASNITFETIGRALIHFSFEPFTFLLGSIFLSIHFNLEVTLAHNCGHGAFNKLRNTKGLENYSSKNYQAKKLPASMVGWKYVHNKLHHVHCNIIGKDPDIGYDLFRVTKLQGKAHPFQRFQVLIILIMTMPLVLITGLRTQEFKAKKLNEDKTMKQLIGNTLTQTRYYFFNFLFFPLLAGLFFLSFAHFLKVILGNFIAECLRGLSYGAMFHMGHHTGTVKFYPNNTTIENKAQWYIQQIETSHNVMMSKPTKYLFGGLDLQIEHHIFPNLPPNKLYEIQPQIELICKKYDIQYSKASFFRSAILCIKNYNIHSK